MLFSSNVFLGRACVHKIASADAFLTTLLIGIQKQQHKASSKQANANDSNRHPSAVYQSLRSLLTQALGAQRIRVLVSDRLPMGFG